MINDLRKLGMEGNFDSMIKSIYKKLTATILFNGEIVKAFQDWE